MPKEIGSDIVILYVREHPVRKEINMLTWRDAEEEAELMQMEAFWSQEPIFDHTLAIEEIELEKTPLRRRLATALVQIGVRIDPTAADGLNPEEAA
jgi:hypothetical protein